MECVCGCVGVWVFWGSKGVEFVGWGRDRGERRDEGWRWRTDEREKECNATSVLFAGRCTRTGRRALAAISFFFLLLSAPLLLSSFNFLAHCTHSNCEIRIHAIWNSQYVRCLESMSCNPTLSRPL